MDEKDIDDTQLWMGKPISYWMDILERELFGPYPQPEMLYFSPAFLETYSRVMKGQPK